jgi:hypothetical protein
MGILLKFGPLSFIVIAVCLGYYVLSHYAYFESVLSIFAVFVVAPINILLHSVFGVPTGPIDYQLFMGAQVLVFLFYVLIVWLPVYGGFRLFKFATGF